MRARVERAAEGGTPASAASPTFLRSLGAGLLRLLRHDGLTQASLATAVVLSALHLGGAEQALTSPPFYRLAIAILSAFVPLAGLLGPPPEDERDQAFWQLNLAAVSVLWTVALIRVVQGAAGPDDLSGVAFAASMSAEFLRVLVLVILVLALAMRPHDHSRQRVAEVERGLKVPMVLLFTLGALAYVGLVPVLLERDLVSQRQILSIALQPLHLYTVLRLLSWSLTVANQRWRAVYLLLGTSLATYALSAIRLAPNRLAQESAFFGEVGACLLAVLALRIRIVRFPAAPAAATEVGVEEARSNPGGLTLLLAVLIPIVHLVGYRLGRLDPDLREPREIVVIVWLVALGALAAIQHRVAQRFVTELLGDRRRVESILTRHERDFLVAERRRHTDLALRRQHERFARAFHSSPYGLMISTLDDASHLEVNKLYLDRIGYERQQVIGKSALDLGIWAIPDDRQLFIAKLVADGRVDDFATTFRRADGELHSGLLSAVKLELQERPCLLTIGRDLTEESREAERGLNLLSALGEAPWPFAIVAEGGKIAFWNDALAVLTGRSAAEALKTTAAAAFGAELAAACAAHPVFRIWQGGLPHVGGPPVAAEAWLAAAESWQFGRATLIFLPTAS
jgi:PAS domain S-box-containing protein